MMTCLALTLYQSDVQMAEADLFANSHNEDEVEKATSDAGHDAVQQSSQAQAQADDKPKQPEAKPEESSADLIRNLCQF
jgi:hypothetical protein